MADKTKSAAPDSSQQQQEESGSWVSNLINKVIHPGSSPQRDEASTSSEQQGEGWTAGGIGAVIGGVVETAKEIINVTADAIATSAQDVKETFVGGSEEGSPSAKHERPTDESVHEPTEKRQRLPSKVKEKIAAGVELTETSTERRSRAKQQWKREQASQPAAATKAIEEGIDQPSGDAERGTNIDALLQQAEASDRRVIGRLTEARMAEYTKLPPEKYKETSKAMPSTYHPPQPTVHKQQKAHMRDPRDNAAYAPFQPTPRGQAS